MKLWEIAKRGVGQPPAFSSPDEMRSKAFEYFQWLEDNPLTEHKPFSSQGEVIYGTIHKMRAATQEGLCIFLNISVSTWHNYKAKPEYLEVTSQIEAAMREQKFTGAAGGFLNANIIARDLGLKESTETTHSGHIHQVQHNAEDYKKAQEALNKQFDDLD